MSVPPRDTHGHRMHPLRLMAELRALVDDETIITCDVGSHYIWMARYFRVYQPHQPLFSNGQQTMGVALPWAIAASLLRPEKKVVSVSGDGGFQFSVMDLETRVRFRANTVHIVWQDGSYDMVGIGQELKHGKRYHVDFGPVDLVRMAEAFGAMGYRVEHPDQFTAVLKQALETEGPVVVEVPIDYSHNIELQRDNVVE
nr:thiamine pyrophosphate-dependent enzyme [Protofrankia symbiont of Coriaria ruscifolia]